MGVRGVKVQVAAAALLMGLGACAERELILPGERFPVRADLSASVPVEGQPAPVAPGERPENQSVPISLGAAQANADWTHRAGNARHQQPHGALSSAPTLVWSANIGQGSSRRSRLSVAPVVADGRIFTLDAGTGLAATGTNGARLWATDLTADFDEGGNVSGGGLAYGAGLVFATTGYGELVAVDPASGAVQWRQRLDVAVTGAPATDGVAVYVAGRDGSAWAVEAATGKLRWQLAGLPAALGTVGTAAPAVGDRAVLFPYAAGVLTAVLKEGGTQVWQAPVAGKRLGRAYAYNGDVTGDPVIDGGRIYLGTAAGRTVALSSSGGEEIWSAGEGALGPVLVVGGSLFLVNDEALLVRLDAETGAVIWTAPMPYFETDKPRRRKAITAHYGPVLAGGRIVVASGDDLLRFFDPASGASLGSAALQGGAAAQPALANGMLYVVTGNGQLQAFR
jgi:outer membrane protein assembly factor BamB